MENNEDMENFIEKLKNQLKGAYRKYKNHVYYDNYSAIQRFDLAKFEVENFKKSFDENTDNARDIFEEAFDNYFSKLANELLNGGWDNKIKTIIENIGVISFPKKVGFDDEEKRDVISNFKNSSSNVSKIHYFIDLPVEGHILGILWIIRLGYVLDDKLYKNCYGNRLNEYLLENLKENDNSEEYDFSPFLFQPYYKKYQSWRDDGLDVADNILKNKRNAIILSLDFKDYYYRSLIDFNNLFDDIDNTQKKLNVEYNMIEDEFNNNLNDFIKEVFERYSSKFIRKINNEALYPNESFDNKNDNFEYKKLPMIPLGFLPSLIIANWNLHGIDQIILEDVNPSYYGRYVDDILMVFGSHEKSESDGIQHIEEINLDNFLNKYFTPNSRYPHNCIFKVKNEKKGDNSTYRVYNVPVEKNGALFYYHYENLEIQKDKLKMYKFLHTNSDAIIKNFRKEISKNSSEFKLMHDSESIKNELEDGIYKIEYNDSINKLNSINDVKINKFEISKILSRLNHASKYMNEKVDDNVVNEIFNAFNGNLLEFMSLWEKIFSFLYVNDKSNILFNLIDNIIQVINSIEYHIDENIHVFNLCIDDAQEEIVNLKDSLFKFLYYSIIRVLSLKCSNRMINQLDEHIKNINNNNSFEINIKDDIFKYHFSLMQNNNLMKYPLQNTQFDYQDLNNKEVYYFNIFNPKNEKKDIFIGIYPRFIKLNELILHEINNNLFNSIESVNMNYITDAVNNYFKFNFKKNLDINDYSELSNKLRYIKGDCGLNCELEYGCCSNNSVNIIKIDNVKKESVKVGILNTELNKNYIVSRLNNPNLSQKRFDFLKKLMNEAITQKVELLILPEVYVPYEWINEIVKISKDHQMAIIFGVEPIINKNDIGNYIFCAFPFIISEKYFESVLIYRLKNHYSPHELKLFKRYDKNPITLKTDNGFPKKEYHMIIWNDIYISPYYCYEIADIQDRSIFKNCCDIVTVSEFNKDTNYFNNIAESLSRDLFCYCIKSNTSKYGGSMIVQPASSEEKYIINLKGGLNDYVVSYDLNIKELREKAIKNDEFDDEDVKFKPNPPGLSRYIIKKRMGLD